METGSLAALIDAAFERRADITPSQVPAGLADALTRVIDGFSTVGGGSAPGAEIPTRLLEISRKGTSADQIEQLLRSQEPPIIARIVEDRVVLDLRTVLPADDALLADLPAHRG